MRATIALGVVALVGMGSTIGACGSGSSGSGGLESDASTHNDSASGSGSNSGSSGSDSGSGGNDSSSGGSDSGGSETSSSGGGDGGAGLCQPCTQNSDCASNMCEGFVQQTVHLCTVACTTATEGTDCPNPPSAGTCTPNSYCKCN